MNVRLLISMAVMFVSGFAYALPVITTCELQNGATFGAKANDCTEAEQQKACDKYKTDPQLASAKAVFAKCKTFDDVDKLADALVVAANERKNPQAGAIAAQAGAAGAFPVAVTCTLKTPKEGKNAFLTLAQTCDKAQTSCDKYKDVPFLGASTSTKCTPFTSKDDFIAWVKVNTANGLFPGLGGGLVTCKTRAQGIEYRDLAKNCQLPQQQTTCMTAKGIADPISCSEYPTTRQLEEELAKKPKKYGLECQLNVGGMSYRVIAPECGSDAVNKELCNPKDGKVTVCQEFTDWQKLKDWTKTFINEAAVTCQVKNVPDVVYTIPGRDCSPESQSKTCGEYARPLLDKCTHVPIEKMKQQMLEK